LLLHPKVNALSGTSKNGLTSGGSSIFQRRAADQALPPGTFRGSVLHRGEERQQPVAVGGAHIFAERLSERQMLRPGLGRQARRIGGKKSERRFGVLWVLGKIEMHAADQVPWRKAASDRLTTRTFDYAARVKPKLSSMTVVGPIGTGSARAVLSFTKLILSFQTFLRKSSKTWIVNCSPGQRR
jgi:hypothetical protein